MIFEKFEFVRKMRGYGQKCKWPIFETKKGGVEGEEILSWREEEGGIKAIFKDFDSFIEGWEREGKGCNFQRFKCCTVEHMCVRTPTYTYCMCTVRCYEVNV